MSEKKEEYAGLVENEAKTVEGDATQMQQYPPAYPADTTTAVMPPQAVTTTQSAPVLTYQPQPCGWDGQTQGFSSPAVARAAADRMTVISIIMCILCCLCGSPLTLACLVPAIIFSVKVHYMYYNNEVAIQLTHSEPNV